MKSNMSKHVPAPVLVQTTEQRIAHASQVSDELAFERAEERKRICENGFVALNNPELQKKFSDDLNAHMRELKNILKECTLTPDQKCVVQMNLEIFNGAINCDEQHKDPFVRTRKCAKLSGM